MQPTTHQNHISQHAGVTYTTQQIAEVCNVKPGTIRSRWYEWIKKIAPESLLKIDGEWSQLARELFIEFSQVEKSARNSYIIEARTRYAPEWSGSGVVVSELIPYQQSETLAILSLENSSLDDQLAAAMASAIAFADESTQLAGNIDSAQIEQWKKEGALQGIQQFKIVQSTAAATYHALLQRQHQGGATDEGK